MTDYQERRSKSCFHSFRGSTATPSVRIECLLRCLGLISRRGHNTFMKDYFNYIVSSLTF